MVSNNAEETKMTTAQFTTARVETSTGVDMDTTFVTFRSERHHKNFTQCQPTRYRDLQRLAKSWGLRATGDFDTLRFRVWLCEFEPQRLKASDIAGNYDIEPLTVAEARVETKPCAESNTPVRKHVRKAKKAKAPKSTKRKDAKRKDYHGLTYREAQNLAKNLREWVVGCDTTTKNVGWDNVIRIIESAMATRHWHAIRTRKSVTETLKEYANYQA